MLFKLIVTTDFKLNELFPWMCFGQNGKHGTVIRVGWNCDWLGLLELYLKKRTALVYFSESPRIYFQLYNIFLDHYITIFILFHKISGLFNEKFLFYYPQPVTIPPTCFWYASTLKTFLHMRRDKNIYISRRKDLAGRFLWVCVSRSIRISFMSLSTFLPRLIKEGKHPISEILCTQRLHTTCYVLSEMYHCS